MLRLSWNTIKDREKMIQILLSGGVIVGTTDTVLGLFAPITKQGYTKLDAIKRRKNKPYLVLVADLQQALQFVALKDHKKVRSIAKNKWPGPVTLIVNAHDTVAQYIAPNKKIALRLPNNTYITTVLKSFQGLFSTSANIAGHPIPQQINQIDTAILDSVDAVITEKNNRKKNKPSTILDITTDSIIEIKRK